MNASNRRNLDPGGRGAEPVTIPDQAVTAAAQAIVAIASDFGSGDLVAIDYARAARAAVEAAAPHITAAAVAAERERLAAVLEAIVKRRGDAEFAARLDDIRSRSTGGQP